MTSGMSEDVAKKRRFNLIPCKSSWDAISEDWSIGEAGGRKPFLGFMMMNLKVCSVRFDVRNKPGDVSIKPVDLFDQVQVLKILDCEGLVLCVLKDFSSLLVWNPYLGQTRSILPRTSFQNLDRYALGYDIDRNHKILRFIDNLGTRMIESEIYDLSSDSWRVLEPTPDLHIESYHGVSLNGVSYFYSQLTKLIPRRPGSLISYVKVIGGYLRSFDFTREKFGELMPLPFKSGDCDTVTLSCVRQEQLAILHFSRNNPHTLEFWVTTEINPNYSSWSKFLKVGDMIPFKLTRFNVCMRNGGSFFIDEEEKVAVVFGTNTDQLKTPHHMPPRYNTAFVLREDGFTESTHLGERDRLATIPLVCSSAFTPNPDASLVQPTPNPAAILAQPTPNPDPAAILAQRKRKDR